MIDEVETKKFILRELGLLDEEEFNPEQEIPNIIKNIYEELHRRRHYNNSVIHVTEICGCLRQSYYYRVHGDKLKDTLDEKRIIVLLYGHAVHKLIQDYLERHGWKVEHYLERKIKTTEGTFYLVGSADAFHPRYRVILELKTCGTRNTEKLARGSHGLQLCTYLHIADAHTGYIIYLNKYGGFDVYSIKKASVAWEKIEKRAYILWRSINGGYPPAPEIGDHCRFCPFMDICKKSRSVQEVKE